MKKGDKVKVEYTGTFDDGTVFDSSEKQGKPLEFEVGSGQIIKGFDDAVMGMGNGQEKEIKLKPGEAYGERNPDLVKKLPKDKLPKGDLEPGMVLLAETPAGQATALITEVEAETVTLDFNHPLAGKNLNFKIKVLEASSG